jgi:hypothetical protein
MLVSQTCTIFIPILSILRVEKAILRIRVASLQIKIRPSTLLWIRILSYMYKYTFILDKDIYLFIFHIVAKSLYGTY